MPQFRDEIEVGDTRISVGSTSGNGREGCCRSEVFVDLAYGFNTDPRSVRTIFSECQMRTLIAMLQKAIGE